MAAVQGVAGAFELGPTVQRVEKSSACQAGSNAVVTPDDRVEDAGGVTRRVAGEIVMTLDQADLPSPRCKALGDRTAGKDSTDDDCVARRLRLGSKTRRKRC